MQYNRYQPPGVYVTSNSSPVITTVGTPATTVTLVGMARGYQVNSEVVGLSSTIVTLAKRGIRADILPGPNLVVALQDGTVLVEGTDYSLQRATQVGETTTIQRVPTSSTTADGDLVVVSYSFSDESYFTPKSFNDYASVESVYGPALTSEQPDTQDASQVTSPISLAAFLAFENGAETVQCVAVEPPTTGSGAINLRTRFQQAYTKLVGDFSTTILVPLFDQGDQEDSAYTTSIQGFINDVRTHCISQSAAGFGRIALVGVDTGYNIETTPFETIASTTSSKRVVVFFPTRVELFNQALGQNTMVGGLYLAAAAAGRLADSGINRGLTQQQVFGFSGIPSSVRQQMTQSFKDSLSASGVAVIEPGRNNTIVVRHGVSTSVSSLTDREINVTRADDVLLQAIKEALRAADIIGDPIDTETTMRVKGIVQGTLETAVSEQIIQDYYTLQVRQQALPSGDPTAIEVQFTYGPFIPLNYLTVSFAMDLLSGQIAVTDEDTAAA